MLLKNALEIEKAAPVRNANRRFTFIDLFAGIGGMRIPFDELGGECTFSSEWDKFAQDTYELNFGHRPNGDITKIDASEVGAHDILLGGFPCQAFSNAGLKQGFLDTRGTMFFEIQRILAEWRPRMFLLENVKQLRGHDGGRTLDTILSILAGKDSRVPDNVPMSLEARRSLSRKLNYSVGYQVLAATEFGVPQKRERVYIVGFDRDHFGNIDANDVFAQLERGGHPTRLGDALEPEGANSLARYTISDKLWSGLIRRMARHEAKGNGFGHKVFNYDDPYCNTITSRYYKDGREILIDQSHLGLNPRRLTPRECARIQGFPEWFSLDACSDTQLYKQFGNSVSVPVIRALAEAMLSIAAEAGEVREQSAVG
ncbi:Type II restriction-modification system methylation subunit [Erythrobacter sp. NAP1]|uniref:DNA cytosine methyltransferase n=1 Tax=Erythrobacter sp. NAP1 TaxID=237727 RepID=UPI00006877BF|nr:DNA cytosine methyltransferase [Erythrobacter sp. NAP1]EAQ28645.1 Type II restriction-modification system methylation subunit [Erythrobacter sp. NAP1]